MRNYTLYICTAAMAMALTGCSVFEGMVGKKDKSTVNGSQATEITKSAPNNRNEIAEEISKSENANKNREIPPIIVQPGTVTKNDTIQAPKAESKVTELSGLARIVGGSWTIIQVGKTTIDRDEDMPYIVFVPGDGSFYANNGCNTLNGAYSISDDKILFHNVLTTMRLCPDVTFDHEINTIICDEVATQLKISEVGSETILEFVSSAGKSLMSLRRGNLEFLNGQWNITSVAGLDSLKTAANVFFDLTDLKLHGNTGCNFINGEIYLDHRMANAVDFSNIITTLKMCQYPEQQTAILVALEETESAISDGADKVLLLDASGKILMELKKAAQ